MTSLKAACVQMTSGPVIADNLPRVKNLVRQAAGSGARLILTPENTCRMAENTEERLKESYREEDHPAPPFFAELAKDLSVWLLIGSISSIRVPAPDTKAGFRLANRSFLFDPNGQTAAFYDKIHMFDADLPNGERYRESDSCATGNKAVVAEMKGTAKIGLSICYDLRFAYLYRKLAQTGAQILSVPAAFTVPTGKAHWEILLRARAIETGCFVLAAGQTGTHADGRQTWGHSMIINPWGEILVQKESEEGIISKDIDLSEVYQAREAIPALKHDMPV